MRPFCIATMGTILGIIMGLYLKSIALFVLLLIILVLFIISLNIITHNAFTQYKKIIFIFLICLILFYAYTYFLEKGYTEVNKTYDNKKVEIEAIVISDKVQKEYKDVYQIEVVKIKLNQDSDINEQNYKNRDLEIKQKYNQNFKMILNLKKDKNAY